MKNKGKKAFGLLGSLKATLMVQAGDRSAGCGWRTQHRSRGHPGTVSKMVTPKTPRHSSKLFTPKHPGTVPSFSPPNTQGCHNSGVQNTLRGRARSRSHTRCTPAPPEPLLPPSLKPHGSPRAPIPTKSTPNSCTSHVRVPCPQVSPTGRLSPAGCTLPGPTSQANSGEVL